MAISDAELHDVFVVSGYMPARQWSQPSPETAVKHHVRFRERHGETGVAAICDGCPEWHPGLENGHDLEEMASLESQHTGMKVTVVREPLESE